MKISGLQKLTLLDYPGKMACTVFTYGCNFRCPFCHNALLVTEENSDCISEDEFFSFLKKRQGILDGVCISGGEPTLQKDLPEFISKIKALGYYVKLDTNGSSPLLLKKLIEEKLIDYVAMDIKNSPDKYDITCGIEVDINAVKQSVSIIKQSGIDHEFRTTTVKEYHRAEDFEVIADWIEGSKYFLQHFENSGNLIGENLTALSKDEMAEIALKIKEKLPDIQLRGV
ncbi:MAG: anaerobic ribonucleoside-triphosphate reductase activating protein [Clostridia bacterium]|nr:anaerobic ribonucleoside-triphosphate reductase activating protein [Clostridia bacterium]